MSGVALAASAAVAGGTTGRDIVVPADAGVDATPDAGRDMVDDAASAAAGDTGIVDAAVVDGAAGDAGAVDAGVDANAVDAAGAAAAARMPVDAAAAAVGVAGDTAGRMTVSEADDGTGGLGAGLAALGAGDAAVEVPAPLVDTMVVPH